MLIETQSVASVCPPSRILPHGARRPASCAEVGSLAGSTLADRFCHWRGRSGQRYVFSVYRVDGSDPAGGSVLPRYTDAVVIAVRRDANGARQILEIGDTGSLPEIAPRSEEASAGTGHHGQRVPRPPARGHSDGTASGASRSRRSRSMIRQVSRPSRRSRFEGHRTGPRLRSRHKSCIRVASCSFTAADLTRYGVFFICRDRFFRSRWRTGNDRA